MGLIQYLKNEFGSRRLTLAGLGGLNLNSVQSAETNFN